jgi:hypothetical protein
MLQREKGVKFMVLRECKTKEQEADLLSELSFRGLGSLGDWVGVWEQLMGYTPEEGKKRRKLLREEGYLTRKSITFCLAGNDIDVYLWIRCAKDKEDTKPKVVQPVVTTIPYIATKTMNTWNEMAQKTGLPKITSVGGTRLSKLNARFKECIGRPDSIWEEIIDGVTNAIQKNKALARCSWLSYDYVIRSQETFDKARQGRLEMYGNKREESSSEAVPSYLRGGRK